jgi:hypothetical protein
LDAIRTRGATTGRFTLVRREHGHISRFPFVIVNELLFELETGMDVSGTVGSGGGADDNGVCNVVTHVREVLAHSIEHEDGEEIFLLGNANGIYASRKVRELSAGKGKALRTSVV